MIPVESIGSATVGNLLYYVSIVGMLLVVATIIRLKIPFLRKAFIPASLIAGLIGLILSPNFLGVIPKDIITSMSRLPTHLIVPVFACMFLGRKKQPMEGKMVKDVMASVMWTWAASFMQFAIPCLLVALVFGPMMGVSDQFGAIYEAGFAGGHGTASSMAKIFEENLATPWLDGGDLRSACEFEASAVRGGRLGRKSGEKHAPDGTARHDDGSREFSRISCRRPHRVPEIRDRSRPS